MGGFRLHRMAIAAGVTACVAAQDAAAYAGGRPATRHELIAASVTYNFARFAQWPATPAGAATGPLVLCVFGTGGSNAWSTFAGEKIGGRTLALRLLADAPQSGPACNIAFIEAAHIGVSATALAEQGVLTISDRDNFLRQGGMIQLVIGDREFKFDVNDAALKRAGVKISSKLMRVGMKISVPAH